MRVYVCVCVLRFGIVIPLVHVGRERERERESKVPKRHCRTKEKAIVMDHLDLLQPLRDALVVPLAHGLIVGGVGVGVGVDFKGWGGGGGSPTRGREGE